MPVSLAARVTEVGTIELWCQSRTDLRRWRLQIQLRGPAGQLAVRGPITGDESDQVVIEQSEIDAAVAAIRTAFEASAAAAGDAAGPARLVKRLEDLLEVPRDQWPPSALRGFWEPLLELAVDRLKSARHESRWFNLAGFVLRPGRGYPLDEVRIKVLWPLFHNGTRHGKDVQCWAEWWILWRRVAAGLSRQHHEEIYRRLAPFLLPVKGSNPAKKAGRPKPEPHEVAEMWRCAASLERLAPEVKESLGQVLLAERSAASSGHVLWCLGRLGARVPLYGPANTVIRKETAEDWARTLLGRSFAPGARPATQFSRSPNWHGSPMTGPATSTNRYETKCSRGWRGWAPWKRPCARFASFTSSSQPSRCKPWAIRCRSGSGCGVRGAPSLDHAALSVYGPPGTHSGDGFREVYCRP